MPRSKKSYEERIDEKDEEIKKVLDKLNQIKAQKHDLEKRKNEEARKARTRRLIIIGGIAEKALGRDFTDGDDTRFEKFLYGQEERGKFYSQAMNDVNVSQAPSEVKSQIVKTTQTKQYTAKELFQSMQDEALEKSK